MCLSGWLLQNECGVEMLIAANKSQPINVWCIPFYLCKTSLAKQNFSFVRRVPWDSNLMQLLLFFKQKKHWNSTDQSQDKISIANESVLLNRQERYECVRVCMCCNKFMWISTLIDSSQSITGRNKHKNSCVSFLQMFHFVILHSFIHSALFSAQHKHWLRMHSGSARA